MGRRALGQGSTAHPQEPLEVTDYLPPKLLGTILCRMRLVADLHHIGRKAREVGFAEAEGQRRR